MTSRPTGPGHAPSSHAPAQGSWVRDYESVEYDVPLLHPQARADSDEEEVEEGGKESTPASTIQPPPPTPPKDPRRTSSATPLTLPPAKMSSSNSTSSTSSSSSSSSASSKSSPSTPPKATSKASNAPISVIDDQRLAKPARAYASVSADSAPNHNYHSVNDTRGAAVGSGPASTSAPVPSTSGLSGSLAGPVNNNPAFNSSSSSTSPGHGSGQGGVTRGAPLIGSQSISSRGSGFVTAPSSAGKTGTQSYGSGDSPRSGKLGSIAALVGENQFTALQLQNISSPVSTDLSLSFSPSSPPVLPSSSASASSSPAFFTPPSSSSPPVVSQAQTQPQRSPPAPSFARPSSVAFRSSPLAHTHTVNVNAMSASNSNDTNKGDYFAVPPSSPGPADLAHAPSAVASAPHSNSGPFLPSSSSSGPTISGLPSLSVTSSSSATIVAPPTPGMTTLASASTVPTLSSTSTPSPPTAFTVAAPLARPPGGSVRAPYAPMMQRIPSDGMEMGNGHGHGTGSGRASADSGTMLRDNGYGYPHPPTFSHHPYPHPNFGPIPRPELHSSASKGSMILYRLSATEDGILPPHPGINHGMNRSSVYSNSGDSIVSLGQDSKHPLVGLGINNNNGANTPPRMNTGGSGFSALSGRTIHPGAPGLPLQTQGSIGSRGGSSLMFSDIGKSHGGLVAYVYDPDEDEDADELDEEEEEWIQMVGGRVVGGYYHAKGTSSTIKGEKASTPESLSEAQGPKPGVARSKKQQQQQQPVHSKTVAYKPSSLRSRHDIPWRGVMNITTLVVLISGLMCLFIVYPVTKVYTNDGVEARILGNTRINATGQAVGDLVDANNGTTLTAAAAGGAAAVAATTGHNGGVDKMNVGNMKKKREALEQLEVDARRRMERWDGLARVTRQQQ